MWNYTNWSSEFGSNQTIHRSCEDEKDVEAVDLHGENVHRHRQSIRRASKRDSIGKKL